MWAGGEILLQAKFIELDFCYHPQSPLPRLQRHHHFPVQSYRLAPRRRHRLRRSLLRGVFFWVSTIPESKVSTSNKISFKNMKRNNT